MKYRKDDEAVDMEIIPDDYGDKEEKLAIGKNYVVVVTSRGKCVHLCSYLYENDIVNTHVCITRIFCPLLLSYISTRVTRMLIHYLQALASA